MRRQLDAGADPNTSGLRTVYHHGKYQHRPSGTLLHIAARGGHEGTVSVLLEGGAKVDSIDADGLTALEIAEESDPSSDEECDNKSDDHAATKKGKAEVAVALREWATAHPDVDYDKRVATYDKNRELQVRSPFGRFTLGSL